MITLYSYFRSSASWRVRTALQLKGIPYTLVPVHLLKDGGEHLRPAYKARNPMATVPLLVVEEGGKTTRIGESLAIIHYLEEKYPEPTLLPGTLEERARIRWIAELVNAGIHPVQNLGLLLALEQEFGASPDVRKAWAARWIRRGFDALEALLPETAGTYCVGEKVSLADVCLLPQVFNGRRFGVDLEPYPTIRRLAATLEAHPAFVAADPHHQPDTPAEERRP
ncbi:MAG: maleylacetoacetate isomerase [Myxococcota bacterium]